MNVAPSRSGAVPVFKFVTQECSSVGRAAVSKTAGREFETLRSCHFIFRQRIRVTGSNRDPRGTEKPRKYWQAMDNNLSFFGKIRSFIERTMDEMRKCTWPTREQLLESTVLVLVVMAVSSAYIAGVDQILYHIITFLTSF